jgi:TATA-binding protein-associated factor Taf7
MSPVYLLNFVSSNRPLENKLKQMIMVREENDPAPEGVEYKHGLTPLMRDARRRRFRREPDLNVIKFIAL